MPRRETLRTSLPLLAAAALLLAAAILAEAQQPLQPQVQTTIDGSIEAYIEPSGVARVKAVYSMSASAYAKFKQAYNPISTFIRQFNWGSTPTQLEDVEVKADDANNRVTMSYRQLGAAVYLGGSRWKVEVGGDEPGTPKPKLVATKGNTLILTKVYAASAGLYITETLTLHLPKGAKNIQYKPEEAAVYYTYPLPGERSGAPLRLAGAAIAAAGAALIALPIAATRRRTPGAGIGDLDSPPPPPPA